MMKKLDASQFIAYCHGYNASEENFQGDEDNLLRFWKEAKSEYLYDLFGKEYIIHRPFVYTRNLEETRKDMEGIITHFAPFIDHITDKLCEALNIEGYYSYNCRQASEPQRFVHFLHVILNNDLILYEGKIPNNYNATVVINGTRYQMCSGQKIMKFVGKVAAAVDLTEEFEQFRIAHSQILNQKQLHGELYLSIHPLDYATASDNESGWSSCMSWKEEGCYRLGTVEMMNSPMVICAYLASDHVHMNIDGAPWPSKKWRAWIIVNEYGIFCNRNYPYDNNEISQAAIKWVSELAEKNLGWKYLPEIKTMYDWREDEYSFDYETNFMYNDVSDEMYMMMGRESTKTYRMINFSGIANCMNCGQEIPFYSHEDDSSTLCCPDCSHSFECSCCNCTLTDSSNFYYGPNDEILCEECYNENVSHCDICDGEVYNDDMFHFVLPVRKDLYLKHNPNSAFYFNVCAPFKDQVERVMTETNVCRNCLNNLGIDKEWTDLIIEDTNFFQEVDTSTWPSWRCGDDYIDPAQFTFEQARTIFNIDSRDQQENNDFKKSWDEWTNFVSAHSRKDEE